MRAQFGHAPRFNGRDTVGGADRRQPVRNDEHRPSLGHARHILLDDIFRFVIEGARRLVKDEDARIGDQCRRDRYPLPLAAGQVRAALLQDGVVALW